ncbi:MAG: dihydropteroate synthase [Sandaracinus sp.]|nr:dihydropteroate synthase [Sandaracinus sp.]MCB9615695.1 dihydropteroate synthase [Sandaracinus sp.]MCB9624824.1 dihydropteroate synthase [Sandaracinus sp.]MCB9635558.1 dihydropteroate synthase [Sandaracinus sp.]
MTGGAARSDVTRDGASPTAKAPLAHTSVSGRLAPCAVWGVLNVTPDSFSDGGRFLEGSSDGHSLDLEAAVAHGLALRDAGADVVDVGGESTRPKGATYGEGYADVSVDEELARVVPVVARLVAAGVVVSVDTVKAEVAEASLTAGATYVNDVSMGRSEALLEVCARAEATLVLMHNRGRGEVREPFTVYGDVIADVRMELLAATDRAQSFGVAAERLWLDPGLGFAKTAEQSGRLLAATQSLVDTGFPVLVGASRKSFLAKLGAAPGSEVAPPSERLGASLAAAVVAAAAGARAVRVHDVAETRQALALVHALDGMRSEEASWR